MSKLYQTKRFEVLSFFSGVFVALIVMVAPHVGAITNYAPGALLQPNDVTSVHIRNYTITGQDASTTAEFTFASTTIGRVNGGILIATSSLTTGATTTFNGVTYKWPTTDGNATNKIQTDGSGNLSWVSGSNATLSDVFVAGESITANDAVIVARGTPTLNSTSTGANASTSVIVSHTVVSGSDRVLVVNVNTINNTVTGVTYAGVAMTLASTNYGTIGENRLVQQWYLVAPTVGSNSIIVTSSGSQEMNVQGLAFNGIDQSSPIGATTTNENALNPLTLDMSTTFPNSITVFSSRSNTLSSSWTGDARDTKVPATADKYSTFFALSGYRFVANAGATTTSITDSTTIRHSGNNLELKASLAVKKASASTAALSDIFIGFANGAMTTNGTGTVTLAGVMSGFTNLVPASKYYISNTSGLISTSTGVVTRKACLSISSSSCLITNSW